MAQVQYITREFIPRVDLTTLGNTFNTLEQGHQAAVQAASDLRAAVGQLDMNEDEDEFKEQLVNEINQTIDDNTLYGNSYGALDNLVTQAGNIQSDGRVIGRLRNQKAKKEYDAKVDTMAIPDGMKQMYKEENPYYYEDGEVDTNTGRVLPGELWEAKTNPVTTVPESEIQKYALQIAAKDAGGGESVSFLDANGKPTPDPMQSVDGAIYKQVGTKWERLSEDKIKQAYQVAIDSIPGAKDSLDQDYRYATWQYDKLVKDAESKGGDTTPYVKGYTDKNGNIYTKDQWLNNKINNFADVAAYNHVYSSVDFGTALQNRKARQAAAAASGSGGLVGALQGNNRQLGNIISGTEETESNAFAGVTKAKNDANRTGLNIVKTFASNFFRGADSISDIIRIVRQRDPSIKGPGGTANYIISHYGKNMTPLQKSQLRSALVGYVQANKQYNQIMKAAGNNSDALRFSSNISNNEFTNDNRYGQRITKWLNDYYKYNKEARFQVGSQVLANVASLYNTDINGLRSLGINITSTDDGNYWVTIDANHRNQLPKFASYIRKANDATPGTLGGWLKNKFTTGVASTNYYEYGIGGYNLNTMSSSKPFDSLARIYDDGTKAASKAETKVGVAKGTRSFSTGNYASFGAAYASMHPEIAEQSGETLGQFINRQNEQVDLGFAQGNFDSGQIQYLDESGRAFIDISKNQDAKTLIQNMYADDTQRKKIKRAIKIPTGTEAGGTQGYVLSFTVPKGFGNKHFKEGQKVNIIISGVNQEEVNFNPSMNPNVLASNAIVTSRATGGPIEIQGYDTNLGNTDLVPTKNGKYASTFMGNAKNMTPEEAEYYTTLMYTLQQFKGQLESGAYNLADPNQVTLVNNKFDTLVDELSKVTDTSRNSVATAIFNMIKSGE